MQEDNATYGYTVPNLHQPGRLDCNTDGPLSLRPRRALDRLGGYRQPGVFGARRLCRLAIEGFSRAAAARYHLHHGSTPAPTGAAQARIAAVGAAGTADGG